MAGLAPDIPKTEVAIVEMTNAARRDSQLSLVRINPQLSAAARAYAKLLAAKDAFSHSSDGRQPEARAVEAGYQYCEIAENLAWHRDSKNFETRDLASRIVTGWLKSPVHRANLLNGRVIDVGVGVAEVAGGTHKFISVQMLGLPRSARIEFTVVNTTSASLRFSFAGQTHELKPRNTITYSSCTPGAVSFSTAAGMFTSAKEFARQEATSGATYQIKSDEKGGYRVEIAKPAPTGKR